MSKQTKVMSTIKPDWNEIYSGLSPRLLGICRRYIQDIHTAEDIVQDSFIVAIQKNHQLNDEKALFAWLKKIVVNNALMYLRKHSKEVFLNTETSEIPDTLSEMNHPSLDEKHIFIYDFTRDQLLSSIDSLPEHHKSVFNLFFIENHSHAEISGMLGITVNTSKSHLMRAKKSVQNFLIDNFINQDTPKNKKKLAQLFVIFGLGGLLWAQTFNSKFSDFSISPLRKLEIPENITINQSVFSNYTNQNLKKKIIIGSVVLIIIAISIFAFNPKTLFFMMNNDHAKINSDIINKKENPPLLETPTKNNETKFENISISENVNSTNSKKSISENNLVQEDKKEVLKENNQSKKIILKDSAKEEANQKVIIVKKIIQRDTIFVER
ncbi:RNA polymerase sigma factor, sigma-70 family [Chryseobacterium soldanellicola]|uniref:RNA polymerase sigma factor n=2 Tax=Chryseobacterium soldanellicola TaxID=311333 RepID=A0A1H1CXP0_9FLAO|nr:RNA polymerase sigma factor, sigma-70 family [Chryseobacterium soldanellicola]